MTWQPIKTAPKDRVIELATFPSRDGQRKLNLCIFIGDAGLAAPHATHWRELGNDPKFWLSHPIANAGVTSSSGKADATQP